MSGIRIGFGFDAHALAKGIPLILGGIEIPAPHGSLGHSDGDVLLHALGDALLGAANLGNIADYFPSDEQTPKGIRSDVIISKVIELLQEQRYSIINIDGTLLLEKPRLQNFLDPIARNISKLLGISPHNVSIKVKTTDGLGVIGSQQGIASYVAVLIEKS